MGIFFSKKPKVTAHDRAVLDLKVQRDKLKQYHIKINAVIERETEIIKQCMKENKKKQAMIALKKKKYQEGLLEKSQQQLDNIQTMVDSVEFTIMERKVFESLKEGNKTLNALHSEMSVEDVEDLMAETADAIAYQNEIETALAGKLTQEDEDDILAELEELEKEVSGVNKLPNVPTTTLPASDVTQPDIVEEESGSSATKTKTREKALVAE
eukprot:Phypoly_transcript_17630.p1 GENE.Phypoly_transcript_17630~~Phypoly_transcript_17630.p1  ORF type:complete len:212 (+),score=61.27 Phypoly_transcript_17630:108-743(+)